MKSSARHFPSAVPRKIFHDQVSHRPSRRVNLSPLNDGSTTPFMLLVLTICAPSAARSIGRKVRVFR